MGFWQSYKSLPKRQRLLLGIIGISIGVAGPYVTTRILGLPEDVVDESKAEKIRRM